jgi:nucleolar pre-ribosomal-associated protein 1
MAPAFMVPRGLQSVLFGDATLEQLSRISSNHTLGEAGEIAHAVLLSLCTDPSHGLCPEESEILDSVTSRGKSGGFGGGQGRLLRLMLRLKVAEVDRHRDILLATARARPKLAISYLASFPLSLEPRVSPAWWALPSSTVHAVRASFS